MAVTKSECYQNGIGSKSINRLATELGYKNKTILITGATGFVGQVLLEKMLRTCPDVRKIYLLLRSKRGKTSEERLDDIVNGPLFDLLKKTHTKGILHKIQIVTGDVREVGLGISAEDRKMLINEVEIVFHSAATTRFNNSIKTAVLANTRGTKEMLDLAKELIHLKAFCYVSTAYSHVELKYIYEKSYQSSADALSVIKAVEWLDEDIVEAHAKQILGDCPNSYIFSKALAEDLVANSMPTLPVIICRPSVIVSTLKDPIPGWTSNTTGLIGFLLASGKGILRTSYCNSKCFANYIPVDTLINLLLFTTFDYMVNGTRRIYNCTSTLDRNITWEEIILLGQQVVYDKMPLNDVIWYPGGSLKTNKWVNKITAVFVHYIPAIFLDIMIVIAGHKPVVWKIQRKINKGLELFEYFSNNVWEFDTEHSKKAWSLLNDTEKQIYRIESSLNLEDYIINTIHGARLYLLNYPDETLPAARRHMKIMWTIDKIFKFLLLLGFGYALLYFLFNPAINCILGNYEKIDL